MIADAEALQNLVDASELEGTSPPARNA